MIGGGIVFLKRSTAGMKEKNISSSQLTWINETKICILVALWLLILIFKACSKYRKYGPSKALG